jgi:hypothetical protein
MNAPPRFPPLTVRLYDIAGDGERHNGRNLLKLLASHETARDSQKSEGLGTGFRGQRRRICYNAGRELAQWG